MRNYELGEKLRILRKKYKLSQTDLGNKLNLSNKAISKWETGEATPPIESLKELSIIYNMSIDELIKIKPKEKTVTKIVITGGPCAGKTTAMSWIQNKFIKDGYNVIFINEAATELITAGITPETVGGLLNFEKLLLKKQLEQEKFYNNLTNLLTNDKVLLVYDRGTSDIKAYLTEQEYTQLLNFYNKNDIELRDNYDAVFHLVTAANGAEKFYTLENNQARSETKEQARELDKKLIKAWTGHPHLRIINNDQDFENKMKNLISEIAHFLGEPEAYEIEKKYLIKKPDIDKLMKKGAVKVDIIQTYLKSEKDEELRVRQRGSNNNYIYYMTRKKDVTKTTRIETEKRLTKSEYLNALINSDNLYMPLKKERYCLPYKNHYLEIDIFENDNQHALLEIELKDENEKISIPKYLEVIKDVTSDNKYRNKTLAKRLITDKI